MHLCLHVIDDEQRHRTAKPEPVERRGEVELIGAVENGAEPRRQIRARHLLQDWLQRADKLPVHDLLDRIYFSADVPHRYATAVPAAMRARWKRLSARYGPA